MTTASMTTRIHADATRSADVGPGSELAPAAYTITAAVRASGLSRTTIYELLGSGQIEARKAGRRTLIPASSLLGYLNRLPPARIGKTGGLG